MSYPDIEKQLTAGLIVFFCGLGALCLIVLKILKII